MNGKKYVVSDIWLTLKIFTSALIYGIVIYFVLLVILSLVNIFAFDGDSEWVRNYTYVYGVLLLGFIIKVFLVYNHGYVIDLEKETFSFPANDVENSIWDIITFKRIRDYAKTKEISLASISDIYIDSHMSKDYSVFTNVRKNPIYHLTISGPYGSDSLMFSSRQKRDELRSRLVNAAKKATLSIRDRRVAEFM
jgi:hypothetical protein